MLKALASDRSLQSLALYAIWAFMLGGLCGIPAGLFAISLLAPGPVALLALLCSFAAFVVGAVAMILACSAIEQERSLR